MEVILSREAEKLIREHIARGAYRDASELIDEAVHLLLDSDRAEAELESLVLDGIESGPPAEVAASDWRQLREQVRVSQKTRKRE